MTQDTPQTHRQRLSHLIQRPPYFGAVEWLLFALAIFFIAAGIVGFSL